MYQQKLLQIIKSFTPDELKECKKYLKGNLSTDTDLYRLFEYILVSKNDWGAKRLEIERARNQIKRNMPIPQFQKFMSNLVGKIEKFIILNELNMPHRQFENQLRLGDFYKRKGLDNYFEQSQRKLKKQLTKIPKLDENYALYQLLQLHQLYFSNLPIGPDVLIDVRTTLDVFYRQKKMVYTLESENLFNLYEMNIDFPEVIPSSDMGELLEDQLILLLEEKEDTFASLTAHLKDQFENYSKESAYRLLNYLKNFCIKKIRAGHLEYILPLDQLNDFGLKTRISLLNGKLSETIFLNLIDVKSKVPNSNPIEIVELIENCSTFTATENVQGVKAVAFAIYYFAIANYSKAWDYARNTNIKRNDNTLFFRVEPIKLASQYMETSKHDNFDNVIKSSRHYFSVTRKGLSESNRMGKLNMITVIEKFWNKEPVEVIHNFVKSCHYLAHRFWIEKEIKRLQG